MSRPDHPPTERAEGELRALIAQVYDDLDEGRFDVPRAIRAIAHAAWEAGCRHGIELGPGGRVPDLRP